MILKVFSNPNVSMILVRQKTPFAKFQRPPFPTETPQQRQGETCQQPSRAFTPTSNQLNKWKTQNHKYKATK